MAAARARDAHRRAYADALRLLARREYCQAEMHRRLARRGHSETVIRETLARLHAQGALSETRAAEAIFRRRQRKGEAPWLTARRARRRGVDEAAVAEVLAKVEAEFDAEACCRRLLERRDPRGLRFRDPRCWARLARFLERRGFDASTVINAMKARPTEEGR